MKENYDEIGMWPEPKQPIGTIGHVDSFELYSLPAQLHNENPEVVLVEPDKVQRVFEYNMAPEIKMPFIAKGSSFIPGSIDPPRKNNYNNRKTVSPAKKKARSKQQKQSRKKNRK